MEIWKDIERYEGYYQVNNYGSVRSLNRVIETISGKRRYKSRLLSQIRHGDYLHVLLKKNGIGDWYEVHQLVAQAFIPNPYGYTVVHHIDHNPSNNKVENLMWVSKEEHDTIHAKKIRRKGIGRKGKRVDQIDKVTGEVLHQWKSAIEASRELGYDQGAIFKCCSKKYSSHKTYKNYIWKYCLL